MNWRHLTSGEIDMARQVFGDSIQYEDVKVLASEYVAFQLAHLAMTPNGNIYFRREDYKPEFSLNGAGGAWLIHELTHVWQFHHGISVFWRGMTERNYQYGGLSSSHKFLSSGIEQQAAIVGEYFRQTHGLAPEHGLGIMKDYENMIPFLPKFHRR